MPFRWLPVATGALGTRKLSLTYYALVTMTTGPNPTGRMAPSEPRRPVPRREPPSRRPLAVPLRTVPPVSGPQGPFRPGPRRADDRRIATAAIVLAAVFLVLAFVALVASALGVAVLSPWLPLHLALAGGASTAIAGVMPFFVSALAAGQPADRRLRAAAVGLVASGAGLVALYGITVAARLPLIEGVGTVGSLAPPAGGTLYVLGIGATALAVRDGGRAGLMMRRPVVTFGYTMALVNVAVGALLATLMVAGWEPVVERWAVLKPAHAWTNLLGFVSLVIVATLLHFLPTVLGTRILPRRSSIVAVYAVGLAAPVVVVGLLLGLGAVAALGGLIGLVGAAAMGVGTTAVVRDRGTWTSDAGWHRFASAGLVNGVGWFVVGTAIATWLLVANGAWAGAWSTALVGAPLVLGWVAQVLMASWTHLLPSIGPGGPADHAVQRRILGRASRSRLVALNAGVALVAVGWPLGAAPAVAAGLALFVSALLATVGLTVLALRVPEHGNPRH